MFILPQIPAQRMTITFAHYFHQNYGFPYLVEFYKYLQLSLYNLYLIMTPFFPRQV